jgi:hypothetical protein
VKRELKRLKKELGDNEKNLKRLIFLVDSKGPLNFRYLENEEHDRRALEQAASRLDEFREELLGEIQSG